MDSKSKQIRKDEIAPIPLTLKHLENSSRFSKTIKGYSFNGDEYTLKKSIEKTNEGLVEKWGINVNLGYPTSNDFGEKDIELRSFHSLQNFLFQAYPGLKELKEDEKINWADFLL